MRILIETNRTSYIDEVLIIICKEYKKIDENVCLGAVAEYKVIKLIKNLVYFILLECSDRNLDYITS
jgi:hypothetical protein